MALTITAPPPIATFDPNLYYTKSDMTNLLSSIIWKDPVRLASTVEIDITTPPSTYDSVAAANGDRILIKNQGDSTEDPAENGIYIYNAGTLVRANDFDDNQEIIDGAAILVRAGTINASNVYKLSNNPLVIGTDPINFVKLAETNHSNFSGLANDDHPQYQLNCSNQFQITDYTFLGTEIRNSGYLVDDTAASRTVLISPDLFTTGYEVTFCKVSSSNTVTLDAGTGNNINGDQTYTLTRQDETITIVKDGADTWKIKSKYEGSETTVFSIPEPLSGGTVVTNIVQISQADYLNIVTPDPNTLYIIKP